MADNTTLNAGSGGDTFAADDIGGIKFPRSKLIIGADGTNDGDVSAANPLPVKGTGTAGTANAGVLTVQGIASMTPVAVSQSGTWDEIGINDSGNSITVDNAQLSVVGTGTEAAAMRVTLATDSTGVLSVDDNGASLTVDGTVAATQSGTWNVGTITTIINPVDVSGSTVAVSGTVTVGSHAVTNAGTFAVQIDAGAVTSLALIDDVIFVDDAAFTPGTSKVAAIGFQADESSTDSVDEGDIGCPRMTLDRKIYTNPQPHTAGGLSVFYSLDLDETEEDVKTSAGCLYKIRATNRTTSPRYLKLYNATAANVTVGSTTPIDIIEIPANASDHTVLAESFGGMGLGFDTALSAAVTTGFAIADTGAPGANDVIASFYYK